MNDLFAGDITEADFIGSLTTWQGRLMTSDTLSAQAKNNSEEQFALGSFKDEFMDVVIEAQDAQNSIAEQMLKDDRIMGVMQKMRAKRVGKQSQRRGAHGPAETGCKARTQSHPAVLVWAGEISLFGAGREAPNFLCAAFKNNLRYCF